MDTTIVEDKPVLDGLECLTAAGGAATLLMTVLGSALVDSTRLRFSNWVPDGNKWAALNPVYAEGPSPRVRGTRKRILG